MEPEFEEMLARGFRLLTEGPQQALLVRTADGEIFDAALMHITEGEHSEEACLLRAIAGKQVTHIVVLCQEGTLDIPSHYFRSQLLQRCPGSENALLLLQTGSGPLPVPLSLLAGKTGG